MNNTIKAAALVALLSTSGVYATEVEDTDQSDAVEEIVVVGRSVTTTSAVISVERELLVDTATVLKDIPGADVNANGPITGIAQYRGMFGDRVAVSIDHQGIIGGGPNAMDTPLSYVSPMLTDELIVQRGIASVSSAPESIGGHINATFARGDFASDGVEVSGLIGSRYSANGSVSTSAGRLTLANASNRVSLVAEVDSGDDIQTPAGDIQPSSLNRDRYDLSYGFKSDSTDVLVFVGKLDTSDTGTAALPMDIIGIETNIYGLQLATAIAPGVDLEGRVSYNDVDHLMDSFSMRSVASPMMARQNRATASGSTFSLLSIIDRGAGNFRFGIDGVTAEHDSVISNPNMQMFRIDNFADVERDVVSAFIEWQRDISNGSLEIGLRYKDVEADAGEVGASGMPAMILHYASELADAFNVAERDLSWGSVDALFKYRHSLSRNVEWNVDLGSKTRAPSYQELYLWLPLQATGGLADGRNYIGNLNLIEERSNEISLGLSAVAGSFSISPQVFFRKVDNYIQGVPSTNGTANMLSMMMTGKPALQFENVDAEIWGLDLAWKVDLSDKWFVDGILSVADGERADVDDYLYRLSPSSTSVGLTYDADVWSLKTEVVLIAEQDRVAEYNDELESAAYQLLNIEAVRNPVASLRIEARVDNLLDETYQDHLAGVNRVVGGDIPQGTALYGAQRTLSIGMIYRF
jgi:iron complex outermembrane receptor protein